MKNIFAVKIKKILFISLVTLITNFNLIGQEIIDSTNFSLNNYLADIEEANNFIRYKKNAIKTDVSFTQNQIKWADFEILVDSVIKQINSEKENIIRFQEIVDLKKKLSFWLRKTKQNTLESKKVETELINDIESSKNLTKLLKKYQDYKAMQYEDQQSLENTLANLKELQKEINYKNLKIARLSANLIKQERRLMLIDENIDRNLMNLSSFLSTRKKNLIKIKENYLFTKELEITTFKKFLSDFSSNKVNFLYLVLYLILGSLITLSGKKNITSLKSYYKSIYKYDYYKTATSFYIIPTLIIGTFIFYLINFDVSSLLSIILESIIVILFSIMMIYLKPIRKHLLSTMFFLLISIILLLLKAKFSSYTVNTYILISEAILAIGLLLSLFYVNIENKITKKIILFSYGAFIILFCLGCLSTNKIYFISVIDFITVISSKAYIFIICGSLFSTITFSFIYNPKLIEASFMKNKFAKVFNNFKTTIFIIFSFILLSYFLSIIGYRKTFTNSIIELWNFKLTLGKTVFHISTFLSFWITLFCCIVVLKFFKNIFSEFISSKASFISKNATLVNLSINFGIYFWSIILAFYASGLNIESLTFIISALSVGIGFGLQNLVSNFISGIILAVEKPIREDDLIELENSTFGTVKNIGVRASLIRTWDGAEITVPNSNLISNQVTNWTLSDKSRRCKLLVGVSYDSDLALVKNTIEEAISKCKNVLVDPEPNVYCTNFLDSSIEFTSILWTNESIIELKSELSIIIINEFRKNNISIPFPQRDIHITEIAKKEENNKS